MNHSDSPDKAKKVMAAAHTFLNSQGLAPIPVNYAVAYELASNRNKALNDAIIALKNNKQVLDNYMAQELYTNFVAKTEGSLSDLAAPMNNMIHEVIENIVKSGNSTSNFAKTLDANNAKMDHELTQVELQALVSTLSEATKGAIQEQIELKEQLHKAEQEAIRLKQSIEAISEEAIRDELTGLLNRKGLKQRLEQLRANDDFDTLTAIMMDIDHFKSINDTYGHPLGDRVINAAGKEINKNVRGGDVAARYGGEEFALLLPGTDAKGATVVAENIRASFKKLRWENTRTNQVVPPITISAGIAIAGKNETFEELLSRADVALYNAKETGRDRVSMAEEGEYAKA